MLSPRPVSACVLYVRGTVIDTNTNTNTNTDMFRIHRFYFYCDKYYYDDDMFYLCLWLKWHKYESVPASLSKQSMSIQ